MKKSFAFILMFVLAMGLSAQVKIGYANLEFILKNMPEAQQMNREIEKYRKSLEEQISAKQVYYQSLQDDYNNKKKEGYSESVLNSMIRQLSDLEQEIQTDIYLADEKLASMSAKKLEPITQKIIGAINSIYEREGYTYIFNSADGTGNSIVLRGPEADNLTFVILKELGVEVEE
jgi:outer membrane protein